MRMSRKTCNAARSRGIWSPNFCQLCTRETVEKCNKKHYIPMRSGGAVPATRKDRFTVEKLTREATPPRFGEKKGK